MLTLAFIRVIIGIVVNTSLYCRDLWWPFFCAGSSPVMLATSVVTAGYSQEMLVKDGKVHEGVVRYHLNAF